MKQSAITALNSAYLLMQKAANVLYQAAERALENEDFSEYSFLESQADKIFEKIVDLEFLIMEQTDEDN